ncbi:hypothetical protein [Mucilaginibacter sp. FT3.2]|uniref:hypothetical protein n=1 Tax=Mucilaginibacter sp. FT3.2 TaxID=2723090 RepID=UPI00161FA74E|nr:hypothetical protein [Mucilaginibacter sp. FT3.2]MBB6231925.1 hypothetical protein [Mucilaginibacter sp. FT3.2]
MIGNLEYLIYIIPVVFIVLSRKYKLKFNRLQGTGKIPDIMGARRRENLFFFLAILSALLILIITNFELFSLDAYQSS